MENTADVRMKRAALAFLVLRIVLAVIVGAHGWVRFLSGEAPGLGEYLASQGIPFSAVLGWTVTLVEMLGPICLLVGRLVLPAALVLSFVYLVGIVIVHAPHGWFIIGHGEKGMEYSVLLIACLLAVAAQELPATFGRASVPSEPADDGSN